MAEAAFAQRRVVVTGAARGLGQALAICLADLGADLVLCARSAEGLERSRTVIRDRTGKTSETHLLDLSDPTAIEAACRAVLEQDDSVDVLVNNAAFWLPGTVAVASTEDIVQTVASTVTGTILMTKGLLPGLRRSDAADVVNVVSLAGLPGAYRGEASAAFHAAKHGQSGFGEVLRRELKAEGIRVLAIYPPDFDDVSPLDPAWKETPSRPAGATMTNREVVECLLFALARPRVCSVSALVLENG
ncbi:MAG: SDR family NAD(P)-dependent oxidoreductase [Rhodospirillales bacterium]|nr:SDR family NAD(P)-dependent oxidoreductase [Rhodospirillales bacterium]MDH3911863.1 SDR family NAD(P)-dependent oxidoreductase [Rhodospirillales bacterium]MDH3916832.1 SDR family NAD(P)-dependent oxidoreductase [Rhodospirillales bacterium]MDH3966530.1 SDR family NAD(P)-dependent oxidoreductase [Rhodospirillales bacterium]